MSLGQPKAAIIVGSGLAEALTPFPILKSTPFHEIDGMPIPTVRGHGGVLNEVRIEDRSVLVFSGRSHLYEGMGMSAVLAPIHEARRRGVDALILTNAVGGLHPLLQVGDIVLASDIIDLTFKGQVVSEPPPSTMHRIFDPVWRARIERTAGERSIPYKEGTYLQVLGPSYETRAEIRMAKRLGADVIGMSTAREAKAAAALGLRVCTLSVVTNRLSDVRTPPLDHHDVVDAGKAAAGTLSKMLSTAIFAL